MLKNHPRGLTYLFFTEMWERFGFYTMQAIFYLYMEEKLLWGQERRGDFYGWFLAAVYFIPILGGWLGDRVLGRLNTIRIGAVLMTMGYVALFLSSAERLAPFYAGLVLIATGTGVFKANVSVLVGNLYAEGNPLRDTAFNIFYFGINLGAALAPLAATAIHNCFNSYNLSFAAAAIGMLVSMVIFHTGRKHFVLTHAASPSTTPSVAEKNASASSSEDLQRILSLVTLFAIAIFFWIAFYQNGSTFTEFAKYSTVAYKWLKPETYQSFGPFFILVLTPPLVVAFGKMREKRKEPSSAAKIFAGMIIAGFSVLIMVFAALAGGDENNNSVSPLWLISSYFVIEISEILVSPMGLSFVSKVAPARIRGLMMGCWFGATAIGGYGAGWLAKRYNRYDHHDFFLIIAGLLFFSAFLVLLRLKQLNRFSK